MLKTAITPLILTFNESPNIDRVLRNLTWASRIVVIDSFSDDTTLDILFSYPQVEVFQRRFDSFADQCNFGLSKITSDWVLSLDADYILTDQLRQEIISLLDNSDIDAYQVRFEYCVFGHPLRGTLLPPRKILYRREKAVYQNDGHAHQVKIQGKIGMLSGVIQHDDRKPLTRWLWAQNRYMMIEVNKLLKTPMHELSWSDRIRRTKVLAPFMILFYCLILKAGVLDGWPGWYYAFQRMLAEILLSIRLIEAERTYLIKSNKDNRFKACIKESSIVP